MKHILLTVLFFTYLTSAAQPEPEQPGHIYLLDSSQVKLLERQKTKKRPNYFYFEGGQSTIQVLQRDSITLIARVTDNRLNPIATVRLYKINKYASSKYRTIPVFKTKTGGRSTENAYFEGLSTRKRKSSGSPGQPRTYGESYNQLSLINFDKLERIFFQSTPFGRGSLKIILKDLEPGNYAVKIMDDELNWNLFDVMKPEKKKKKK